MLARGVKDNTLVSGLRPETPQFLFLTATGADKRESQPSPAFPLTTHDKFAEK